MGYHTEDIGRLCDAIDSECAARRTLIAKTRQALAGAVHGLISDLKEHRETPRRDVQGARADMRATACADRMAFLGQLGGTVADLQLQAVTLAGEFAGAPRTGPQAWRKTALKAVAPRPPAAATACAAKPAATH